MLAILVATRLELCNVLKDSHVLRQARVRRCSQSTGILRELGSSRF